MRVCHLLDPSIEILEHSSWKWHINDYLALFTEEAVRSMQFRLR
jgi:hypothetical protein